MTTRIGKRIVRSYARHPRSRWNIRDGCSLARTSDGTENDSHPRMPLDEIVRSLITHHSLYVDVNGSLLAPRFHCVLRCRIPPHLREDLMHDVRENKINRSGRLRDTVNEDQHIELGARLALVIRQKSFRDLQHRNQQLSIQRQFYFPGKKFQS